MKTCIIVNFCCVIKDLSFYVHAQLRYSFNKLLSHYWTNVLVWFAYRFYKVVKVSPVLPWGPSAPHVLTKVQLFSAGQCPVKSLAQQPYTVVNERQLRLVTKYKQTSSIQNQIRCYFVVRFSDLICARHCLCHHTLMPNTIRRAKQNKQTDIFCGPL